MQNNKRLHYNWYNDHCVYCVLCTIEEKKKWQKPEECKMRKAKSSQRQVKQNKAER